MADDKAFDPVRALPAELLELVLSYLRPPEAARAREVCRAWAAVVGASPEMQARAAHCRKFCRAPDPEKFSGYSHFLSFAWQRDFSSARALGFGPMLALGGGDEAVLASVAQDDHRNRARRHSRAAEQQPLKSTFGVLCDALAWRFITTMRGDGPEAAEVYSFYLEWRREIRAIPAENRDCCPRPGGPP